MMRHAVQAESMKDQLTDRQLNLLNGVDLSEDEYDEINTRVIVGLEATTEDKYAVERHQFKLSYGLDRLSAEFLSDVKFQAAGMSMIVQQNVALGSTKGPMRHNHSIMFAEHTRELLDALRIVHIFDDDRHLTDDELVALREVLQQTHFFQNYSANIKIYSPQAKTVIDFTDAQAIVRAVNAVIGKAEPTCSATIGCQVQGGSRSCPLQEIWASLHAIQGECVSGDFSAMELYQKASGNLTRRQVGVGRGHTIAKLHRYASALYSMQSLILALAEPHSKQGSTVRVSHAICSAR